MDERWRVEILGRCDIWKCVFHPSSPRDRSRRRNVTSDKKNSSRPIEDYGLIGNMISAALVSRGGSIDWLCLPRFDSDACFAALLGSPENGRWLIAPHASNCRVSRRYLPGTAVLETRFETDTGAVCLIDFMPLTDDEEKVDVVRIVKGEKGSVE